MKIAFKTTLTDAYKAAVMMENTPFLVSDILPLCKASTFVKLDTDVLGIYLSIDKLVQSAGSLTGSTYTTTDTFQRLTDEGVEVYRSFNKSITVSKFVKGTTYLIPFTQFACVNFIPQGTGKLIENYGNEVYPATKFLFQCTEDTEIMNANSISGVHTVEFLGDVALKENLKSEQKKRTRVVSVLASTGVSSQTVAEINSNKLLG